MSIIVILEVSIVWHIMHLLITIQIHSLCAGTANKAGKTPLSLAYEHEHWEVVKYLSISHHCDTTSNFHFISNLLILLHLFGQIYME